MTPESVPVVPFASATVFAVDARREKRLVARGVDGSDLIRVGRAGCEPRVEEVRRRRRDVPAELNPVAEDPVADDSDVVGGRRPVERDLGRADEARHEACRLRRRDRVRQDRSCKEGVRGGARADGVRRPHGERVAGAVREAEDGAACRAARGAGEPARAGCRGVAADRRATVRRRGSPGRA